MKQLNDVLRLFACLVAGGSWAARPAAAEELLGSKDLAGWELVTPEPAATLSSVASLRADGVLALAGKPVGYLVTKRSFRDYRLQLEYRWPADTSDKANSGILVHVASGPIDRGTWPLCLQVQTKRTRAGDILPMAGATFKEPLTSAAGQTPQLERRQADSEKPVGEWNKVEIVSRGGSLEVSVNGVLQNRVTGSQPAEGRIGFQLEGVPYELRAVTLTPPK